MTTGDTADEEIGGQTHLCSHHHDATPARGFSPETTGRSRMLENRTLEGQC